jgi:hypothetical protein
MLENNSSFYKKLFPEDDVLLKGEKDTLLTRD